MTDAVTVAEPETVAPLAGAVIDTTGAGGPAFDVVTDTLADVPCWPSESVTAAVNVCEPLEVVVLSHKVV